MQTLTDALARAIGGVRTGTRAAVIAPGPGGGIAATLEAGGERRQLTSRAVILAVPADQAAALVAPFAPDAALSLEAIPYAPVVSVARAYERRDVAHPLDGFGFLVPRLEPGRILGSLFSSSMFEGRAPAEAVLLTTFVGGRRDAGLALEPDETIERLCDEALESLVGARGRPRLCAITRWPRAIPQYTLGHLGRVARAQAACARLPGLFLCASWQGGVAVGDRIVCAHETAETTARFLTG